MAILKVVIKRVPQHVAEDSSLRVKKTDGNVEGLTKGTQSPGTQQTDSSQRARKTNGMPRVVLGKKEGLDMQQTAMPMVVPKTTLAHNGQTSI